MFHRFFNSLPRSRYLSFFPLSYRFILWSAHTAKSTILQILLFFLLLIIIRSSLLTGISWSVCLLKSHRSLCESFSRTGAGLCIYHLFVWSNWNFLHISQRITLPTQSCLALYSFCANLLHSLIMWLIVASLSRHSLHLLLLLLLLLLLNTHTHTHTYTCSIDWGCRIHLHLCRGVRPPLQRVSCIWH